jgi:peptidoglycan/xylan/chitin deacetylase (PgdA/CDA1 family)
MRRLLPSMTWEMGDANGVFITIDDGPTPGITEWILEELAKRGAKATFFCLGKNIELYPHLYQMIIDAGHKVGNHTYSHKKGWGTSPEQYMADVKHADTLAHSDLFRPPYGRITRRQAEALRGQYRLVMGSVVSRDYNPAVRPEKCLKNVTRAVSSGSIVVFHDSLKSYRNMSYALPRALDHICEMGLEFRIIDN